MDCLFRAAPSRKNPQPCIILKASLLATLLVTALVGLSSANNDASGWCVERAWLPPVYRDAFFSCMQHTVMSFARVGVRR